MSDTMISKLTVAALAGAAALAALAAPGTTRAEDNMEKCYGISKAGENSCANAAGTHSCAGHSTQTYFGGDWKLVPAGTCADLGGRTEAFDGFGQPRG